MEPFLTVQCLKPLKEKGLDVNTLIMDVDTTTFVRASLSEPFRNAATKTTLCAVLIMLYTMSEISARTYLYLTSKTALAMPSTKIRGTRKLVKRRR